MKLKILKHPSYTFTKNDIYYFIFSVGYRCEVRCRRTTFVY
jgi:hypothetical protein